MAWWPFGKRKPEDGPPAGGGEGSPATPGGGAAEAVAPTVYSPPPLSPESAPTAYIPPEFALQNQPPLAPPPADPFAVPSQPQARFAQTLDADGETMAEPPPGMGAALAGVGPGATARTDPFATPNGDALGGVAPAGGFGATPDPLAGRGGPRAPQPDPFAAPDPFGEPAAPDGKDPFAQTMVDAGELEPGAAEATMKLPAPGPGPRAPSDQARPVTPFHTMTVPAHAEVGVDSWAPTPAPRAARSPAGSGSGTVSGPLGSSDVPARGAAPSYNRLPQGQQSHGGPPPMGLPHDAPQVGSSVPAPTGRPGEENVNVKTALSPEKRRLGRALLAGGPITHERLLEELDRAGKGSSVLGKALVQANLPTEEELLSILVARVRIPKIKVKNTKIPLETIRLVPAEIAKRTKILAIEKIGEILVVVSPDVSDENALAQVRRATGCLISPIQCEPEGFDEVLDGYYDRLATSGLSPAPSDAAAAAAVAVAATPAAPSGAISAFPVDETDDAWSARYVAAGPLTAEEAPL